MKTQKQLLALRKEIEQYLRLLWLKIGIDQPSNNDEIVKFIYNDVNDTADPVFYHSGDLDIAFRRFIEKNNNI